MQPDTHYAKSGDVRIAYQVVGSGPFDLVFVPGFISNLDLVWEEPSRARFFSRLASCSFCSTNVAPAFRIGSVTSRPWKSAWTTCVRSWMRSVANERPYLACPRAAQ